jgi:hypothetical protein
VQVKCAWDEGEKTGYENSENAIFQARDGE